MPHSLHPSQPWRIARCAVDVVLQQEPDIAAYHSNGAVYFHSSSAIKLSYVFVAGGDAEYCLGLVTLLFSRDIHVMLDRVGNERGGTASTPCFELV